MHVCLPGAQLIGNKSDLEHRRAVTYEEGEQFAKVSSRAVPLLACCQSGQQQQQLDTHDALALTAAAVA